MKPEEQETPENEHNGLNVQKINDNILLWLLNDKMTYDEYLEVIADFD